MKQCKFYDKINDAYHGGIIDNEGNIICGCCGSLIPADEIGDSDECKHKIIKIYEDWVNLDEWICE